MRFGRVVLVIVCTGALVLLTAAGAAAEKTVLCSENVSKCPKEKSYGSEGHVWVTFYAFPEQAEQHIRLNIPALPTVECDGKLLNNTMEETSGPLKATDITDGFTACQSPCSMGIAGPAPVELEKAILGFGTLRVLEPRFNVECSYLGFLVKCTYTTDELELPVIGSATAPRVEGGPFSMERDEATSEAACSEEAELETRVSIVSPNTKNVFVTAG